MSPSTASWRYEALVDRWLDFTTWPVARRTTVAAGIALAFHLVVPTTALYAAVRWSPGLVIPGPLAQLIAAWVILILVVLGLSIVAARRGSEGRWIAYLFLFGYMTLLARMLSLLGTMTGPWVTLPPLVRLFALIFFERTAGRLAFAYVIVRSAWSRCWK